MSQNTGYFLYSDTEEKRPGRFKGGRGTPNPHNQYIKHLENWFFLKHICAVGSLPYKFQATIELVICERKLDYWSRKPNFIFKKVEDEQNRLASIWKIDLCFSEYNDQQLKWLKAKGIKVT